jgi:hypothetical protein
MVDGWVVGGRVLVGGGYYPSCDMIISSKRLFLDSIIFYFRFYRRGKLFCCYASQKLSILEKIVSQKISSKANPKCQEQESKK